MVVLPAWPRRGRASDGAGSEEFRFSETLRYLLVAILKKQLGLELSLCKILQILSVTIFEKSPILQVFLNSNDQLPEDDPCSQLQLFDL